MRFAAGDMLWRDATPMAELDGFLAERWPRRERPLEGPVGGPVAVFCELLPVLWFLKNKPGGSVVRCYAERHPKLFALAGKLARDARFTSLKNAAAADVLAALWPDLIIDQATPPPQPSRT